MSAGSLEKSLFGLVKSRRKSYDDPELDIFEAFKFICFLLGVFCITAQFLMSTQSDNPWKILEFFQQLIFSVVISSNVVMEAFVAIAAFFFAYRLFQV